MFMIDMQGILAFATFPSARARLANDTRPIMANATSRSHRTTAPGRRQKLARAVFRESI